jgi:hypothetical protein
LIPLFDTFIPPTDLKLEMDRAAFKIHGINFEARIFIMRKEF